MKTLAIISGGLVALALGVTGAPVKALTICASDFSTGVETTGVTPVPPPLSLSCSNGNFQSRHRAINDRNLRDLYVTVDLVKTTGGLPAQANSIGVDIGHAATGVACSKRDTNPNVGELRSGFQSCNGTAHPLAMVFGTLST
jgi:hypothetical protein